MGPVGFDPATNGLWVQKGRFVRYCQYRGNVMLPKGLSSVFGLSSNWFLVCFQGRLFGKCSEKPFHCGEPAFLGSVAAICCRPLHNPKSWHLLSCCLSFPFFARMVFWEDLSYLSDKIRIFCLTIGPCVGYIVFYGANADGWSSFFGGKRMLMYGDRVFPEWVVQRICASLARQRVFWQMAKMCSVAAFGFQVRTEW